MPGTSLVGLDGADYDDPIVHDPLMYLVTRTVSSFYGGVVPTDPTDAAAVNLLLGTGGNTHLSTFITVGRLPVDSFIPVNQNQTWANTENNLWAQILADAAKDPGTAKPSSWAASIRLLEIRNYLY